MATATTNGSGKNVGQIIQVIGPTVDEAVLSVPVESTNTTL